MIAPPLIVHAIENVWLNKQGYKHISPLNMGAACLRLLSVNFVQLVSHVIAVVR